jgi:hypothetical protein
VNVLFHAPDAGESVAGGVLSADAGPATASPPATAAAAAVSMVVAIRFLDFIISGPSGSAFQMAVMVMVLA